MGKFVDRTGQKHWQVTFISKTDKRGNGGAVIWHCRCDCGKEFETKADQIISGHTKSCGCISTENKRRTCIERNTTHGLSWKHKLYGVWIGIRRRCNDPKFKSYRDYGFRGISVCAEWIDNYKAFYEWAMQHGYRSGLEIDRINNDGNYSPENCRFVTRQENCKNKRNKYTRHI